MARNLTSPQKKLKKRTANTKMITLSQFLSAKQVICQSTLSSKKRVLEMLSQLLSAQTSEQNNAIYTAILKREHLGSTAMGRGIAIPHARVKGLPSPQIAAITLAQPIQFDAPDDKPVDLVIGLAVPDDSTEEHLKILADLSTMLSKNVFLEQLRHCKDNADLYNALMVRTATHA